MMSGRILANGRLVLFVLFGLALIGVGVGEEGGTGGLLLALVGLVPLSAGLFGWCPGSGGGRDDDPESGESDGDGSG
jgi:hypothetical protein